jgi:hypothetical protein
MNGPIQRIVLVDLRVPYLRLVLFFIKAMFALIPAAIVVGAVLMVLSAALAAFMGGNFDALMQRWRP